MYFIVPLVFLVIGYFMIRHILRNDKGSKEPTDALWRAGWFGVLSLVLAGSLNSFLPEVTGEIKPSLSLIFFTMMGVGLIEEAVKFFPFAIYVRKEPFFNEYTDSIIYFGIIGLLFGIVEDIMYSLAFGEGVGLMRIILTPLFHMSGTAFIGYFFVKSKLENKSLWQTFGAYLFVAVAHGLYNFGVSSEIPLLIVFSFMLSFMFTLSIFLLMTIAREADEKIGMSAIGKNNFCRSCGAPNPSKMLYCTRCGNKA